MTGRHEIHCHYCPCHFGSLYPAAEFSSLQCFLTSRKQGLWLRLGWGQDCELHLPQGSHRLNWLCFLTCWIRLFVRCGFKVGNDEYSSEFGASLFSFFNACISKGWGLCPLRSERGIILQIMLPKRFKVIPERNNVICSWWHKRSDPQSVMAFRGKDGALLCSRAVFYGSWSGSLPRTGGRCGWEGKQTAASLHISLLPGNKRQEERKQPQAVQGSFRVDRKNFSLKEWSGIGTSCAGKWWSHCPWKCLRGNWMWHLGHGLGEIMGVLGWQLDWVIWKVSSNLDPVIL